MTTFHLMHRLEQAGVTLRADGDRLIARGALTPGLRAEIRERKAEIVMALHLARIAAAWSLPAALTADLPDEELGALVEQVAGMDADARDAVLLSYLYAIRDTERRGRGTRLEDETVAARCRHCGPVWLAPEVAAVAPVVAGWPRVLGCPWCHLGRGTPKVHKEDAGNRPPSVFFARANRETGFGDVPRPSVACADCHLPADCRPQVQP